MRMETSVSARGRGAGIRGGRLCSEAAAQKQLQGFSCARYGAVFRGPCARVHDTPDPVPRRPQATPHAGPARSPASARSDANKRAGAASAGQGRGATPGGGRWLISTRPPGCQTVPPHGLQTLDKVNLGVGCGVSFLSDFTPESFKSKEFDNTRV